MRVGDTERVNRDVIFDLDSMAEEVATVSSHLSTEIFDNDEALCRMDAELLVRNIDLVGDIIVPETLNSTTVQPNETGSSVFYFVEDDLEIAKQFYETQLKLTAVDHDNKVKAELSSIFDTPRYKSPEARAIVVHAAKFSLIDVMLIIYTTYHSPLCSLLFSYLDHSDVKTMIEAFHWLKPMMNYSFHSGFLIIVFSQQCLHVAVSGFLFKQFKRHLNTVQMHPGFWILFGYRRANFVQATSRQGTALWHFVSF
jgi:hypothetical protein